jgi:hypothetical protein
MVFDPPISPILSAVLASAWSALSHPEEAGGPAAINVSFVCVKFSYLGWLSVKRAFRAEPITRITISRKLEEPRDLDTNKNHIHAAKTIKNNPPSTLPQTGLASPACLAIKSLVLVSHLGYVATC